MADVHDKEKRSAVMLNIKSKGNKITEISLIEVFRETQSALAGCERELIEEVATSL